MPRPKTEQFIDYLIVKEVICLQASRRSGTYGLAVYKGATYHRLLSVEDRKKIKQGVMPSYPISSWTKGHPSTGIPQKQRAIIKM